jgi:N-acetylglutamate synthase-like GNAT family acetyltransferase
MLRRATSSDLPAIAALIAAHPMQLLAQDIPWLERLCADPEARVLVWDRGGFAGFAVLETSWPQVITLLNLAVARPGQGAALIRAALDTAFNDLGAHRIFLDTAFDNPRALAAFQRAGFVQEGVMRQCWLRPDGIWADCIAMGLLRSEWRPGAAA